MTVSISGLTFEAKNQGTTANSGYARFDGSGTYTAADFTITPQDGLGFSPSKVHVVNLTDAKESTWYVNSNLGTSNAEGLVVANHATAQAAYVASGVSSSADKVAVTIDVSAGATITDDDDFVIEMWS